MIVLSDFFEQMGLAVEFLWDIVKTGFRYPCRFSQVTDQIWKVSIQSLPTTALAGFFVGAILTVQFTLQIKEFGALGYLGGLATSGTVREIGPLLIAFLLSGKVGAFTSAELGTMKVTEQIDAIRCLGANPLQEIILPRFIGIVISSFFLLAVGLVMSLGGGVLLAVLFSKINAYEYLRHVPTIVAWPSIVSGLFKCFCFAFVLAWVCTFKGYSATGGAKGVGKAVVQTAVATMIGIVILDWVTSQVGEMITNFVLGI